MEEGPGARPDVDRVRGREPARASLRDPRRLRVHRAHGGRPRRDRDATRSRRPWLGRFCFGDGDPGLKHARRGQPRRDRRRPRSTRSPSGSTPTASRSSSKPGQVRAVREARRGHRLGARGPAARRAHHRQGARAASQRRRRTSPIGTDPATGLPVYAKNGRFGPYVQLGDADTLPAGEKPKMASLFKTMTLERLSRSTTRSSCCRLPRVLGTDPADGEVVEAGNGRYGPFVRKGKDYRVVETEEQLFTITLDEALALLAQPKQYRGRGAPEAAAARARQRSGERAADRGEGRPLRPLRDRRRDQRVAAPRRPVEEITPERAAELLQSAARPGRARRRPRRPPPRRQRKKTGEEDAAKKTAAKKAAAKKKAPAKKAPVTDGRVTGSPPVRRPVQ